MGTEQEIKFPKMLVFLLLFLAILWFIPSIIMYKIVQIGPIKESAAILFFPLVYPIADSITEVYGRKITYYISVSCYVLTISFALILREVIHLPSPAEWRYQEAFNFIFNRAALTELSGFLGMGASMYVNVRLMSSLKRKMRGRHFIIRSIISSSIGELVMTGVAYPIVFYPMTNSLIYLMLNAYLFKVAYSVISAFPAKVLVFLLRKIDGIEQHTYNKDIHDYFLNGRLDGES